MAVKVSHLLLSKNVQYQLWSWSYIVTTENLWESHQFIKSIIFLKCSCSHRCSEGCQLYDLDYNKLLITLLSHQLVCNQGNHSCSDWNFFAVYCIVGKKRDPHWGSLPYIVVVWQECKEATKACMCMHLCVVEGVDSCKYTLITKFVVWLGCSQLVHGVVHFKE